MECVVSGRAECAVADLQVSRGEVWKKLFPAHETCLDAVEMKQDWIGRTETMQFHFGTCIGAPSQGEKKYV